ncbi:hypothetical protein HK096_007147, partial [Nowakowskiella sp. JEL0078]
FQHLSNVNLDLSLFDILPTSDSLDFSSLFPQNGQIASWESHNQGPITDPLFDLILNSNGGDNNFQSNDLPSSSVSQISQQFHTSAIKDNFDLFTNNFGVDFSNDDVLSQLLSIQSFEKERETLGYQHASIQSSTPLSLPQTDSNTLKKSISPFTSAQVQENQPSMTLYQQTQPQIVSMPRQAQYQAVSPEYNTNSHQALPTSKLRRQASQSILSKEILAPSQSHLTPSAETFSSQGNESLRRTLSNSRLRRQPSQSLENFKPLRSQTNLSTEIPPSSNNESLHQQSSNSRLRRQNSLENFKPLKSQTTPSTQVTPLSNSSSLQHSLSTSKLRRQSTLSIENFKDLQSQTNTSSDISPQSSVTSLEQRQQSISVESSKAPQSSAAGSFGLNRSQSTSKLRRQASQSTLVPIPTSPIPSRIPIVRTNSQLKASTNSTSSLSNKDFYELKAQEYAEGYDDIGEFSSEVVRPKKSIIRKQRIPLTNETSHSFEHIELLTPVTETIVATDYTTKEIKYATKIVDPSKVKIYTITEYTTQDFTEVNEAEGYDVIEVVEDGVKRFLKRFFTTTSSTTRDDKDFNAPTTIVEPATYCEPADKLNPVVSYTSEVAEYDLQEVVQTEVEEYITQSNPETNVSEVINAIESKAPTAVIKKAKGTGRDDEYDGLVNGFEKFKLDELSGLGLDFLIRLRDVLQYRFVGPKVNRDNWDVLIDGVSAKLVVCAASLWFEDCQDERVFGTESLLCDVK